MIIAKTPFRISFFGGGTDFPDYFVENGGCVLSTSIDKYCYVNIRNLPPFFDYNNEIVYSKIEQVKNLDDINHPMVKNILKYFDIDNIKISYDADLPARTGLGTSSSFAVGLINAISKLKNIKLEKKDISDLAIYVERELCKEEGGIQDQIAATFGGFNFIKFNKANKYDKKLFDKFGYSAYDYEINKIDIDNNILKTLNNNLFLFFTGISRNSFEIQKNTQKSLKNNTTNLNHLNDMVDVSIKILKSNNIDDFGHLLNDAWKIKKSLSSSISNNHIDDIYEKGINCGAIGGKILGAGGGGFILFYVPITNHEIFKSKMSDLMNVPFKFENDGTSIIYESND